MIIAVWSTQAVDDAAKPIDAVARLFGPSISLFKAALGELRLKAAGFEAVASKNPSSDQTAPLLYNF
jgi:hypothetical protein